jgi:hypothetical protein
MASGQKMALDSPVLAGLFRSYEHTAFRLEVLQGYEDPDEEGMLREFLAGGMPDPDPGLVAWCQLISDARAAGKVMQRVHVIRQPHSRYIEFELYSYRFNVEAGDDVRIIPVSAGASWPAGVPQADWWLFDSRELVKMIYDDRGRLECAELLTDPSVVVKACQWRDAALHAAVPYDTYMGARLRTPAA